MVRAPDDRLLTHLATYDPDLSALVLGLREVILDEAPEAIESIVRGYALAIGFSFTGKPLKDGFCHIAAYTRHVNLGFNRGALLADPNRVLAGTGRMIRHVTFTNLEDLSRPFLRWYLRAAIEQVRLPAVRSLSRKRK